MQKGRDSRKFLPQLPFYGRGYKRGKNWNQLPGHLIFLCSRSCKERFVFLRMGLARKRTRLISFAKKKKTNRFHVLLCVDIACPLKYIINMLLLIYCGPKCWASQCLLQLTFYLEGVHTLFLWNGINLEYLRLLFSLFL